MPAILEWTHTVVEHDLDGLGHANNISYLKWMQSAALAHSAAQGWPVEAYAVLGCGWVVRSHFIEYLSPALLGDTILIRTWVADMGKVTSRRRFLIVRADESARRGASERRSHAERGNEVEAGETVLAKAETNWAFVDYRTGSPKRIPPEVSRAFEIVVEDAPTSPHNGGWQNAARPD